MFDPSLVEDATPVSKHLTVPSASILLNAHYSRDGDDLVLDHGAHVLRGYFGRDGGPSDLVSADGFTLSGKAVMQLAGQAGEYQIAQSGEGVAGAPLIGHVETISGTATAQRGGAPVELTIGSDLFQGDVIETGPASKLGVSFIDKTVMTLSASARVTLDEMTYTPNGGSGNKAFISLLKGSAAFIAGMTAPAGGLKIDTPVATAGIRGTMPIIVAPGEGGMTAEVQGAWKFLTGEGSYIIENAQGQKIAAVDNLTKMVIISSAGAAPVEVDIPPDIAGRMQDGLNELLQTLQKMLERRAENTGSPEFDTASRFGSIDASDTQVRQIFTKLTNLLKETALQQDAPLEQDVALIVAPIEAAPLSLDLDGDDSSGVSGIDFTTSFIEKGAGVTIADTDISIVVGDANVEIVSATVVLTNAQAGDSLAFGVLPAGMTGSIEGATITLSGALTLADYQVALQAITFASDSTNPSTTPRIITVTVTDSLGASTAASSTINIIAVNDAPRGADQSITIGEDGSYAFRAQDFGFEDSDGGSLKEVVLTSLPQGGRLLFNGVEIVEAGVRIAAGDLGKLVFVPAPGASGDGYAQFGFQVVDTGGTANGGQDTSAGNLITINVGGVNDAPSGSDATVTTNEDGTYIFANSDFGFSDSEGNQLQSVVIFTVPAAGVLTLDGGAVSAGQVVSAADIAAGKLVFAPAANTNGPGYASFDFQVVDDGGTASGGQNTDQSPNTITIDVSSVNDAPSGTDKAISINEDGSRAFAAADFGFKDSDGNALKEVIITGLPAAGALTFNGVAVAAGARIAAGDLDKLVYAPDKDATGDAYATIRFQVVDDGGALNGGVDTDQSPNVITINVGGVNDAPSGRDATIAMAEDSTRALRIDDFGFSDSDGGGLLEVRIASLPTAGELRLNGIAVTLNQVVSAADIEAGKLVFAPAANTNGPGYASFDFQVVDNGGSDGGGDNTDPTPNTITFDVLAVNDAPSGSDRPISIDEDSSHTFAVSDFGFSDVNDSDALAGVKISSLPLAGVLLLGVAPVVAGQVVSAADIAAGKLVFVPADNANGAGYASFTFQVLDTGGTANGGVNTDPTPNTITINIGAVNDPPSGADATLRTLEDTSLTFRRSDFGFTDQDGGALSGVKITALPAAGRLLLDGKAIAAGATVSAADIDAGKLTFEPAANANGQPYTDFTFQVVDTGGTASGGTDTDPSPNTIRIEVTSVNDAPSGADASRTINEDSSYTFKVDDFGFSDAADGNTLRGVKLATAPAGGALRLDGVAVAAGQEIAAVDIAAGKLVFVPLPGASGAGYGTFTFQVVDAGGVANGGVNTDQSPNTFVINVNPVNDAPAGANAAFTTLEDTPYSFSPASFGFSDSDGNAFQAIVITSLPGAGLLTLNNQAVSVGQVIPVSALTALVFKPAANANGSGYASFTFQVRDDGGLASNGADTDPTPNTITINVTPVNDAPSGADKPISISEDQPYAFSAGDFVIADVEGNALKAIIIASLPAVGLLTFKGAPVTIGQEILAADLGNLVFTPSGNATGEAYAAFDFRVVDSGGTANGGQDTAADVNTVTISVGGVNDAPSGADGTVTAIEDTAYTFKAGDFGFTDVDGGGLLSVIISTLPTNGTLRLNGGAVTAGQEIAAADIGKLTFTAAADANGASYAKFTFQVKDNGGTANGGIDTDPIANTITIDVLSRNDAPSGANKSVSIDEDRSFRFSAGDFGFSDVKDGDAFKEVIIATLPSKGALFLGAALVSLGQKIAVADIGNLEFRPGSDDNGSGYGSFTFQVVDDGGRANDGNDTSSAFTFTINVNSVNDAPGGTDGRVVTLEDTAYTFATKDFGFSDNIKELNTFQSVVITTLPDAGTLKLGAVTVASGQIVSVADILAGRLKFEPAANDNGSKYATFTFQVMDDGGTANGGINTDPTPNEIVVDVTSVNDAPFGSDKAISIAEDSTYAFNVGDFGFSDPDRNAFKQVIITTLPSSGKLSFNGLDITTTNFTVDVAQIGLLTYRPADDAVGTASFQFKVVDDGGKTNGGADTSVAATTITFSVGGVNDAPSGANRTVETSEDTAYTFKVSDFGFTDPEGGGLLSVKITTLPALGSLKLNGQNVVAGQFVDATDIVAGALKYVPVADDSGTARATFTFQVRDNGGVADGGVDTDPTPNTITVNVLPVNDAPVAVSNTITIKEDAAGGYVFSAADFKFTDVENNGLNGIIISSLPTNGTLRLGGSPVTAGTFISAGLISSLVFTPALNANGTAYASFEFQVQDNGGTLNGGVNTGNKATITFNVTAVNDAPVNTLPATFSATDDAAISLSGLRVSDLDAGTGSITVTLSVTDGALTASSTALVTVSGSGTGVLSLSGQVAAVDAFLASSLVDYRAPNNYSGNATLTMSTTDNGNSGEGTALTDTDTAVISVVGGPNYDVSISNWNSLVGDGEGFFAAIAGNGAAGSVFRPLGPAGSRLFISNNDVTVGQSAPNEIDGGEGIQVHFRAGVIADNGSGVTAEGAYLHATAAAFTMAQKNSASGQADIRITLFDSAGAVVDLTATNFKVGITGGGSIAIDAANNWITIDNGVAGTRFEIVSNSDLTFSSMEIVNTGSTGSFTISGASIDLLETTIVGTTGANTIAGNDEANLLTGLGGDDILTGNGGNDILIGGEGSDSLRGGAGKDVFMFDQGAFTGSDTIEDYVHNTDAIDLSILFDQNPAGVATLDNGSLLFDRDGGGSAFGNVQIASFAGPPPTAITILDDGKATVVQDA